jgi:hypothetical protein
MLKVALLPPMNTRSVRFDTASANAIESCINASTPPYPGQVLKYCESMRKLLVRSVEQLQNEMRQTNSGRSVVCMADEE